MNNLKWYQKNPGIVLMIILFFPIGLFLMWSHASWSTLVKAVITGVFAVLLFWNSESDNESIEIQHETADQLVEEAEGNINAGSEDLGAQKRLEAEQARQDSIAQIEKERERQKCIDDADALFLNLQDMYVELQSFRKTRDFKNYGFGRGGKYFPWLEKIGEMRDDPRNRCCLIYKGCVAGDLEMLGMEYVSSEGQDTDYSISTSKLFK